MNTQRRSLHAFVFAAIGAASFTVAATAQAPKVASMAPHAAATAAFAAPGLDAPRLDRVRVVELEPVFVTAKRQPR